ncbi:MAG TPA: hypothetical protein VN742_07570, partial [Candidatus Binataceae bacterium]|nr:hypothetical protein [Candidatus Binataceae bacterium]
PAVMLEIPFVLITFFQAGKLFTNYDQFLTEFRDQPTIAMSPTHKSKAHARVVWLLFDELDNGMIDGSNRFGVAVPEIDRLRHTSCRPVGSTDQPVCGSDERGLYHRGRGLVYPILSHPQEQSQLLVKLPGQHHGVRYDRKFNTEILHDMILALIRGNISDPVELTGWLNENTTTALAPVPISACPPFNGGGSGGSSGSRAGMDPSVAKTLGHIAAEHH